MCTHPGSLIEFQHIQFQPRDLAVMNGPRCLASSFRSPSFTSSAGQIWELKKETKGTQGERSLVHNLDAAVAPSFAIS